MGVSSGDARACWIKHKAASLGILIYFMEVGVKFRKGYAPTQRDCHLYSSSLGQTNSLPSHHSKPGVTVPFTDSDNYLRFLISQTHLCTADLQTTNFQDVTARIHWDTQCTIVIPHYYPYVLRTVGHVKLHLHVLLIM